jgi:NADPH-dependent glutamate synthase beta subunit-like oxidoreductase
VPGVEDFVGNGVAYQNPFIQWFNHKNERAYDGPEFEVPETGVVVVGGGLASLDVIKVVQLELYERALARRGFKTDMYELEHEGIPEICARHGIDDPRSLGVKDGVLLYRRRAEDMPLAQEPDDPTPEQRKKTEATRRKILEKVREKFLFRFEERALPHAAIVEGGRIRGLVVRETRVEGRKADPVPGSEREVRGDLIVSSIGSVPERIDGIAMQGDYYVFKDRETGEYAALPGVFAIGNVITGQGNIRASLVHGQRVSREVVETYLGVGDSRALSPSGRFIMVDRASAMAEQVVTRLRGQEKLAPERVAQIFGRVRALQKRVGYDGDYKKWIAEHTPPDFE